MRGILKQAKKKVDPVPLPHFVLAFPRLGLLALFSRGTAATAIPGTNINGAKSALLQKQIPQGTTKTAHYHGQRC